MPPQQFKFLLAKLQQPSSHPQGMSLVPPPAYTPVAAASPSPSLFQPRLNAQPLASTAPMATNNPMNGLFAQGFPRDNQIPSPTSDISPQDAVDYDPNSGSDYDQPAPSISISLHTPITVHGNNNVLYFSPADTGAALAKAIIGALKDSSMSSVGIPMIDENGAPRPIHVNVTAGVEVRGAGNRVGAKAEERAVLSSVPPQEEVCQVRETALRMRDIETPENLQRPGLKRGREDIGGGADGEARLLEGERERKAKKVE